MSSSDTEEWEISDTEEGEIIEQKICAIFDMILSRQIKEIIIPSQFVYGDHFSSLCKLNGISGKLECQIEIDDRFYDQDWMWERRILKHIYLGDFLVKTYCEGFPYYELFDAFRNGWEGITLEKENCEKCVSNIDLLANMI